MPSQLSLEKRSRISVLIEEGYSSRQIAFREKVAHSTIIRINQKLKSTGSLQNRPKTGRPRLFTKRFERKIIRYILTNECFTAVDIQNKLKIQEKINVSVETIRRILKANGFKSKVKSKKPFLSKKHKQKRLKFAQKYKCWTIEDWKKIVWSDECKFMLYDPNGRQYCWKKSNEPIYERHIKPTLKFGGGNIMVWGCFCFQGIGNLCRINEKMDSELYCQVLEEDFLGTLEWYNINKNNIIFQQDNDPKHTSKLTRAWLNSNNINVLEWPAQSPDLNPIEHIWREVKNQLRKIPKKFTSKEILWDILQDIWNNIEMERCVELIETMPERINDIIKAKGEYTKW
jgi:transposase